jgi:hypothetical protein
VNNELKNDKERSKEAFDKLDPRKLKIAVTLGDAICKELGICCEAEGQVMFEIYKEIKNLSPDNAVVDYHKLAMDSVQTVFDPKGPAITEKSEKGGQPNG